MNTDRWVEGRLALLEPARGWRPDAARAFAGLRERDRVYHVRRRRWMWITVAASMAALSVLAIPGRCDAPNSNSCGQPLAGRLWREVFPKPVETVPEAAVAPVPVPALVPPPALVAENQKPATPVRRPAQSAAAVPASFNFKEAGSANASIVLEIYTDYECPACAALYRDVIPALMTQYVQTGKVRVLHRDFPLPQHTYARLAARYANAAGELGQYDLVANALFQTQNIWEADGSVDKQVTQVLAPGTMQKVRELVKSDGTLDDTVNNDLAMGMKDAIHQTPTIIVVSKGKRQPIAGLPDFNLLKNYLDQLLAK